MVEFKLEGKEMLRKAVSEHGNGGVIYVPKQWIGKSVVVILEGK
jgi:putative transposon-encoded protein